MKPPPCHRPHQKTIIRGQWYTFRTVYCKGSDLTHTHTHTYTHAHTCTQTHAHKRTHTITHTRTHTHTHTHTHAHTHTHIQTQHTHTVGSGHDTPLPCRPAVPPGNAVRALVCGVQVARELGKRVPHARCDARHRVRGLMFRRRVSGRV